MSIALDKDAFQYIRNVEKADGAPLPLYIKIAINDFVVGCKQDQSPKAGVSNWDAIKSCCLWAGPQTINGAMVPLRGPAPTVVGSSNFVYNSQVGLKMISTGSHIDTNYKQTEDIRLNNSVSIYVTQPHSDNTLGFYVGAGQNQNGATQIYQNSGSNLIFRNMRQNIITLGGMLHPTGFIGQSRTNDNSITTRVKSESIDHAYTTQPTAELNFYIFRTSNGFETNRSIATMSYYAIGESVDLEALENRITRYMGIFDQDAIDYIAAVEAADGAPLQDEIKVAIGYFIAGCKLDKSPINGVSNWDAFKTCALFAGPQSLAGALIPLKGPNLTNYNFTNSDYDQLTGLKGNGSTKYIYTGVKLGEFNSLENTSLSVFTTEPESTSTGEILAGRTSGGGNRFHIRSVGAATKNHWIGTQSFFTVPETVAGFSGASRHDLSSTVARYGGIQYTSTGSASVTIAGSTDNINVFAQQNGNQHTTARISWYHFGESTDILKLENRIKEYMSRISLGFDADAAAYIYKVEKADGRKLPNEIRKAINDLIVGCKADESPIPGVSNWDALKACCLLAGPATLGAALVPLKGPAPTNLGFNQDDYHQVLGLAGTKDSNKYLIWNGVPNDSLPERNVSIGAYSSLKDFPTGFQDLVSFGSGGNGRIRLDGTGTFIPYLRSTFQSPAVDRPASWAGPCLFGCSLVDTTKTSRAYGVTVSATRTPDVSPSSSTFRAFQWRSASESTNTTLSFVWCGEAVDLTALETRVSQYMHDIAMGFDHDAARYIYDVEYADGSELQRHIKVAINRLISGCKEDPSPVPGVSNWDAIKSSHLMAGPQTIDGVRIPLKGSYSPTRGSLFTDDDFDKLTGLKSDGIKRWGTGRYSWDDPTNNTHISVYVTSIPSSGMYVMSDTNVNGRAGKLIVRGSNSRWVVMCNGGGTSTSSASSQWFPFIGVSRHSDDDFVVRWDKKTETKIGSAGITDINYHIIAFGQGNGTAASDVGIAFYSVGESVDLELLEYRVERYMRNIRSGGGLLKTIIQMMYNIAN